MAKFRKVNIVEESNVVRFLFANSFGASGLLKVLSIVKKRNYILPLGRKGRQQRELFCMCYFLISFSSNNIYVRVIFILFWSPSPFWFALVITINPNFVQVVLSKTFPLLFLPIKTFPLFKTFLQEFSVLEARMKEVREENKNWGPICMIYVYCYPKFLSLFCSICGPMTSI